jgi:4a-hydroxytetrahydrobiopterin dehydratase
MAKLSNSKIEARLKVLDGWRREDDFITKTFEFKTFMAGVKFVNDVAAIAEKLEHHPDINIRWTTITMKIQSHDEGGITARDFRLATEIEKFLHQKPSQKKK